MLVKLIGAIPDGSEGRMDCKGWVGIHLLNENPMYSGVFPLNILNKKAIILASHFL